MQIGIDGNEANVTNRVGSNVYAYEVLRQLHKEIGQRDDVSVKVYLKEPWKTLLPEPHQTWKYSVFGPKQLWTQWRLPLSLYAEKAILKNAPSVFFSPGHYAPRLCPVPSVITIMDLAFLKFPQEFRKKDLRQLSAWTKYSVANASHILTISKATKKDVCEFYGVNENRVTVTYPSASIAAVKTEKDNSFRHFCAYYGITQPFLLYVGTLQPRKNITRLIEAFSTLKSRSRFKEVKLVIVGKKGWIYESMFAKMKELGLKNEVVFTGFVSEWEKVELLKHASAFVLPSLYEGFGIPVLEAMLAGTPVLVSRVSSLPEVGGDAVSYIEDPKSVDEIERKLAEVLQLTENKRLDMIARQREQAQKFSWEKCGKKTLEALLNVKRKK